MEFAVDAVLFDLDGTLVDSTDSVERAWHRVADELAIPVAQFLPYMHGIPAPQVFARVAPGLPARDVAELTERMLAEQATDTAGVLPAPGALRTLAGLPPHRWAIVTSGDRRLATARIRAAGLPLPRVLVTADDVPVGKPDPAPYLQAAAALRFDPVRCLAVEDAPAGVASARAAGMPVLGLRTTHDDLAGASAVVADLAAVHVETDRLGVHVGLAGGHPVAPADG